MENFMSSLCVWFDEIIASGPADTQIGVCIMQNQNFTQRSALFILSIPLLISFK